MINYADYDAYSTDSGTDTEDEMDQQAAFRSEAQWLNGVKNRLLIHEGNSLIPMIRAT